MTVGEDETVAVDPLGVLGVVVHDGSPERVRNGGAAHRSTYL